jgi:pimeloyl-ACP methyl ester carboxylesterase
VYLPGLHGDWTLIGGFRKALGAAVTFVEVTYPRSLSWSLDEYAGAIETALKEHSIGSGWILAESFGSQIAWAMAARKRFELQGLILAGGFVKHPAPLAAAALGVIVGKIPFSVVRAVAAVYARVLRVRYRRSPEVLASVDEFMSRRTDLDRKAVHRRLNLLAESDFRPVARAIKVPVYGLTGLVDPIVPWPPVRRWLGAHCPTLAGFEVIVRSDHNVLGVAPAKAARVVLGWMLGAG